MNNIELSQDNEKKFNNFLRSVNLYEDEIPLVKFEKIQDEEESLTGEIMISTKRVRKILEKELKQKPSYKPFYGDHIWSFKIKGLGWIIIQKFEESSFLTLKNKWW